MCVHAAWVRLRCVSVQNKKRAVASFVTHAAAIDLHIDTTHDASSMIQVRQCSQLRDSVAAVQPQMEILLRKT